MKRTYFARALALGERAVFILLLLALCLLQTVTGRAAGSQSLHGNLPDAVKRLTPLGRTDPSKRLSLSIGLPLHNQAELAALLKDLYNPASPRYRHFLKPQDFTERYGPTTKDYESLIGFAKANGLSVTDTYPNRLLLDVEGSVPTIEKAFHVKMQDYQHPSEKRIFYAPDVEPSVDLATPILHISGLDNYALPHPNIVPRSIAAKAANTNAKASSVPQSGSGPGGTYAGNDFRSAYAPGTSLTGAGQSVGLLEFDGYYASDITAYESQFSLPNVSLVNVDVDNVGTFTPGSNNDEVALDIEMAIAMAPGISHVYVYEAPNFADNWDRILNRMASDDLASQLSASWTGGGPDATAEAIFQQMAAQGQSFFAASGDSDAYTGSLPFPTDSPSITVVGGTTLTTSGAGGAYVSETAWNWGYDLNTGSYVGSSGGISTYYSIPTYQQAVSMASTGGSTTLRNVPDVAMVADNVYVTYNNGSSGDFGGTSCAAPLWAAFTALVNQQAVANGLATVGFLNPMLYSIGNGGSYSTNFNDVTSGNNFSSSSPTEFAATSGYDLCTGWGTPGGSTLINTLAGAITGPPVITSALNAAGTNGAAFNYHIVATNHPSSYGASVLPAGLTFSTSTGIISGTVTAPGSFNVSISATNAGSTGRADLTINVQEAPTITNGPPPVTAPINTPYSFTYEATGYPVPTFSVTPGSLPTGLSLSSAGAISGTPTVMGTYTGTVSASNGFGTAATQAFSILVLSPPAAPTNLTAAASGGSIVLNWTGSTSATGYNIDRGTTTGGPYTAAGSSTTATFTDSGVTGGLTYYYVVTAQNAAGVSPNSNEASATALTGFQQWLAANNLSMTTSQDSTPDNDGVPLLLKYATGLTPGTPSVAGPAALSASGNFLTLVFHRLNPAPDNYLVESSPDLVKWSSLATLLAGTSTWTGAASVAESGTNPVAVTVTDSVAMPTGTSTGTATPRFLRLRVTTSTDTMTPGTVPQGDVPVSLTGTTTGATSLPLDNTPVDRNSVQAVATSALTVVNAGTWSSASTPFALRLLSGTGSGATFAVSSVSGNTVNLATQGVDLTQLVAVGDLYEILPLDTLGSLYGTTSTIFQTGGSATSADNVLIWNGSTFQTYYNNGSGWARSGSFISQNNLALPAGGGLMITRRATTAATYTLVGRVPEVALQQFTTPGGYTFLAGAYPVSGTIAATGFAGASGWLTGSTASAADNVLIWNGSTWQTLYDNGANWARAGTFLNENSYPLPVGEPLMIYRRSTPTANNAFVTQPLPYTP